MVTEDYKSLRNSGIALINLKHILIKRGMKDARGIFKTRMSKLNGQTLG